MQPEMTMYPGLWLGPLQRRRLWRLGRQASLIGCLLLALTPRPVRAATPVPEPAAWLVRAPADWRPPAGWQVWPDPSLAALGLARVVPIGPDTATASLQDATPDIGVTAQDEPTPSQPNDADWALQYAPPQIQLPDAWSLSSGCGRAVIAIVDSGVDFNHPDLVGRIWFNQGEIGFGREANGVDDDGNGYVDDWHGWDFVNGDNDPRDDYGHGTHVTGIANATANNQIGIAGVAGAAWGVQAMVLKVLDNRGNGFDSKAAAAVVYAVDNGAQIVNLSLGDPRPTPALEAAIDYATERGVLVVAAAGNSGAQGVYYPARYDQALAVGAVTAENERAFFSSYGPQLDLVAPGFAIYSTALDGSYGYRSGTSMATPHVSGTAALLARLPDYSDLPGIRDALLNTTLDLAGYNVEAGEIFGNGLVQARSALEWRPLGPPPACYSHFLPALFAR
jgi:subtilisin family serine protease